MCFAWEEKSSDMSEKVAILITALAVFVLLSDLTLNAKRRGKFAPVVSPKNAIFLHSKTFSRESKHKLSLCYQKICPSQGSCQLF